MTTWLVDLLEIGEFEAKLILTALIVIVLGLMRLITLRIVVRRTEDVEVWYRTRKATTYVVVALGTVLLAGLWIEPLRDLGTFLGLLSAGIAIALADLIKNVAGWLFILIRRPFRVGDRIEIDGDAGDVIDLRVGRFSILEIGNWVHADQSTGRILHIPNGKIFTATLANATEGFNYIWHEVEVLITFESDWQKAEEMFREVLDDSAPDVSSIAAERIRAAAHEYNIRFTHVTPTVYVSTKPNGVLLTGRMLVDPRTRRGVEQNVWRGLLTRINEDPDVELAYPTTRMYLRDPIGVQTRPASEDS